MRANYLDTPQLTGPSVLEALATLEPWLGNKILCLRLAKLRESNFFQNSIISKLHLIFPFCFSIHMRIEREAAGNGPLPVQTQNGHSTSGVKRVSFGPKFKGLVHWLKQLADQSTTLESSCQKVGCVEIRTRGCAVGGAATWSVHRDLSIHIERVCAGRPGDACTRYSVSHQHTLS